MAKEILLYGDIYDYSAQAFINAMNELDGTEEMTLRINSNGGNPNDMAGMIDKFQSYAGPKKIKIDGKAFSSAFFFSLYVDAKDIEATDLSRSLIHRAAYPKWVESNPDYMTAEMWSFLDSTNKNLRTALEARVKPEDFAKVTGKTIDEVFSNDNRIDVFLSAQQMKKLGLIGKINKLTPAKMQEIEASFLDVAANYNGVHLQDATDQENVAISNQANQVNTLNEKQTKRKMTADQFKAEHPDLFASVHASGVNQERERVKAILVYHSVDAQKSVDLVNAGTDLTASQREEFNLKAITKKEVSAIEGASAPVVTTEKVNVQSEVDANFTEFEAAFKNLKGGVNA